MKHFALLTLSTALLAGNVAWAHGNQAHSGQHAHAAKEQKDWGIAGEAKDAKRTITLTMNDKMRFTPSRIQVKQGETVRLRIKNSGKLMHELVLGTPKELAAHAAMMAKHPGMEHDEPYMAHVAPGKTGEIVWTFNRAGDFEFACLIAGHFQAGMKGTIRVIADPAAAAANASAAPAMHGHMHGQMHGQMHGNMQGGMHGNMGSSYAGQHTREIKALSAQEMTAYVQGQGHGFAKAAELNGYPGPMHVLELAEALKLSAEQREKSQALMTAHKAEARRLGTELIEAERALDQAFASRNVTAESLTQLTRAAGEKLAALRAEHLQAHLAQTALLTPEQIERYKTLRGYDSGNRVKMNHQEMNHGQHKH